MTNKGEQTEANKHVVTASWLTVHNEIASGPGRAVNLSIYNIYLSLLGAQSTGNEAYIENTYDLGS